QRPQSHRQRDDVADHHSPGLHRLGGVDRLYRPADARHGASLTTRGPHENVRRLMPPSGLFIGWRGGRGGKSTSYSNPAFPETSMATRDTLAPAEAKCSSGAEYAALALQALQEPTDAAYAKELMDRVADDCQFTKDLAACAIVYKALGEQGRAEELLQTAEDYCMSGEEQVALAEAKFKVLGDKAAAVGAYEKALKETGNLDPLIELA